MSRNQLKDNITNLIEEVNAQQQGYMLSYSQIEKVNSLTKITRDFTSICPRAQMQETVEHIVMNEENFKNCERNCLPLKIFRDLFLQGGISFDVQSMFTGDRSQRYTWFASLLLNIENLGSLNNLPGLKKQLLLFIETEVIPALIISAQNGNIELIMELIESFKNMITDQNYQCLVTLQNFI